MPCSSQGSRSDLSVGIQSDFDIEATVYNNLPYTSQSLNLTKDRVVGTDLQSDRQTRVDRHGNKQVGGDIVCDLRAEDFDTLIRSAMLSDWSTVSGVEQISIGTTPLWLSFQDISRDLSDLTRKFVGCSVSTMAISMAPNQMITTTFGIVGQNMTMETVPEDPIATTGQIPFDSYSGSVKIGDSGGATLVSNVITSVDFTLTNSFGPTFIVGSPLTGCLEYGRAELEGTITTFFENADEINRFIAETETSLEIAVSEPEGDSTYTFLMPRVKINSADGPVDGPGSRIITFSFVAIKPNLGTDNMFTITKSQAANNNLRALTENLRANIEPDFDESIDNYDLYGEPGESTITIVATADSPNYSAMTIDGATAFSGVPSDPIDLVAGQVKSIDIEVTAENGNTQTYNLSVNSGDTDETITIASLTGNSSSTGAGGDDATFSPAVTVGAYPTQYQVSIASGPCYFVANATNASSTMTIDGVPLAQGAVSQEFTASGTEQTINLTMESADGSREEAFTLVLTGT